MNTRIPFNFTFTFTFTFAVSLLGGCASPINVAQDQKLFEGAKPCCSSVAALPTPVPIGSGLDFRLSPDSPHFDLGEGLAPLVIASVDPTKGQGLEVLTMLHTTTLEAGNHYHFRGVVPNFVFLNSRGDRLPSSSPSKTAPVAAGLSGQYALSTQISIPSEASTVIVTTKLSAVGSRNGGCIHPGGGGRPVAYDQCVAFPAGVLKVEDWRGAIYGRGKLLQLQASQ